MAPASDSGSGSDSDSGDAVTLPIPFVGSEPARRVERLDLDPDQPPFLVLGAGSSPAAATSDRPATKPRMGPVEASGVMSGVRSFLADMQARTAAEVLSPPSSADPEIVRGPAEETVRVAAEETIRVSTDNAERAEAEEGPHVHMDLGLGVFDVHGLDAAREVAQRLNIPEAAGCLPGEEEIEDQLPALIQEVETKAAATV